MVQTQDVIKTRLFRMTDKQGNKIAIDPNNMQYLLLIFFDDDDAFDGKTFEIITGRSNVIEYLSENYAAMDFKKSFLLSEEDTLAKYTPMRTFLEGVITRKETDESNIELFKSILSNISDEE